jgi:pimeloyl-ACP methyl ester carboxylesterase
MLRRPGAPALQYWDDGRERPPVVLIHGVGADGTNRDQVAAAPAPEFRVLRLDLRGHGRSGHIEGAVR